MIDYEGGQPEVPVTILRQVMKLLESFEDTRFDILRDLPDEIVGPHTYKVFRLDQPYPRLLLKIRGSASSRKVKVFKIELAAAIQVIMVDE